MGAADAFGVRKSRVNLTGRGVSRATLPRPSTPALLFQHTMQPKVAEFRLQEHFFSCQRSDRTAKPDSSHPVIMAKSSSRRSTRQTAAKAAPTPAAVNAKASGRVTSRAGKAAPEQLQKQIDEVDRQLLQLVEQRCSLVRDRADADQAGIVVRMAEAAVRAQVIVAKASSVRDRIGTDEKQALLRHVSSVCLGTLHQTRVAFLGPLHSYSHLAAIKYFGDAAAFAPVASIQAVFEAVSRHDAVAGIVPVENSTDGRVVDTLSTFVRRRMQVCGEVLLPIHHHLLSRTPRELITEVYSKPQALSQCRSWLANHLPQAKLVEISSTAAAARIAADKQGAAAVASAEAGREYSLDVIDANIEDNPNNITRFVVLGREQPEPTGDDKTAILFQVNHEPGALADAMTIFKKAKLNLTWIESFPLHDRPNEYVFFVELTGHRATPAVGEAIATLSKRTQRLDVLGSYPRA